MILLTNLKAMKVSELRIIVKEVLEELHEISATGTGASFTPGVGAQYATPYAFKKGRGKNRATKYLENITQYWKVTCLNPNL